MSSASHVKSDHSPDAGKMVAVLKQQQAEIERLRGAVSKWASECGECLGEGVVMTKSGAIEYEPCPDCADIRAFLEPPEAS
jgi:hypothetical protein